MHVFMSSLSRGHTIFVIGFCFRTKYISSSLIGSQNQNICTAKYITLHIVRLSRYKVNLIYKVNVINLITIHAIPKNRIDLITHRSIIRYTNLLLLFILPITAPQIICDAINLLLCCCNVMMMRGKSKTIHFN